MKYKHQELFKKKGKKNLKELMEEGMKKKIDANKSELKEEIKQGKPSLIPVKMEEPHKQKISNLNSKEVQKKLQEDIQQDLKKKDHFKPSDEKEMAKIPEKEIVDSEIEAVQEFLKKFVINQENSNHD